MVVKKLLIFFLFGFMFQYFVFSFLITTLICTRRASPMKENGRGQDARRFVLQSTSRAFALQVFMFSSVASLTPRVGRGYQLPSPEFSGVVMIRNQLIIRGF